MRLIDKFRGVLGANNKKLSKNQIFDHLGKRGYSYVSDSLSGLGKVKFGYDTMYKIQRFNTEAQAGKNKIVKMVGKYGVDLIKNGEVVKDKKMTKKIIETFTDPVEGSFFSFRDKYYTNHFCTGMVFGYIAKNGLGEPVVQIMDSRYIRQELDDFGNLKKVFYGEKEIDVNKVIKQVTQYDPNVPGYGMSVYESVVYDAMSDYEASRRNFYFFKNNAMPRAIISFDDGIENQEELDQAITKFEENYKGTENSNKILAAGGIKQVTTLDFSNRDLELLELKRFAIKKIGVLYGFDPRFLGYKDDKNGSHAEYEKMASQSDKSMTDFADILEEFLMKAMTRIDPSFTYDHINLLNDQFLDKTIKQEMVLQKVEKGLCTLKQGIRELGYSVVGVPDFMDTYMINTQWNSVENILKKSEIDQESMKKEQDMIGKEVEKDEKRDVEDKE